MEPKLTCTVKYRGVTLPAWRSIILPLSRCKQVNYLGDRCQTSNTGSFSNGAKFYFPNISIFTGFFDCMVIVFRILRAVSMTLSHISPIWDACGGFNIQLQTFFTIYFFRVWDSMLIKCICTPNKISSIIWKKNSVILPKLLQNARGNWYGTRFHFIHQLYMYYSACQRCRLPIFLVLATPLVFLAGTTQNWYSQISERWKWLAWKVRYIFQFPLCAVAFYKLRKSLIMMT